MANQINPRIIVPEGQENGTSLKRGVFAKAAVLTAGLVSSACIGQQMPYASLTTLAILRNPEYPSVHMPLSMVQTEEQAKSEIPAISPLPGLFDLVKSGPPSPNEAIAAGILALSSELSYLLRPDPPRSTIEGVPGPPPPENKSITITIEQTTKLWAHTNTFRPRPNKKVQHSGDPPKPGEKLLDLLGMIRNAGKISNADCIERSHESPMMDFRKLPRKIPA